MEIGGPVENNGHNERIPTEQGIESGVTRDLSRPMFSGRKIAVARELTAFKVEQQKNTLIIVPQGDSLGIQEMELESEINQLHKILDEPGLVNLVVDVGSAPYFGSIVIGAIMALCLKARDQGGLAVLCNASPAMLDVIKIMKLDSLLPYYSTREEAVRFVQK